MNEYPLIFDTTNQVHFYFLLLLLEDMYTLTGMQWKINEGADHRVAI